MSFMEHFKGKEKGTLDGVVDTSYHAGTESGDSARTDQLRQWAKEGHLTVGQALAAQDKRADNAAPAWTDPHNANWDGIPEGASPTGGVFIDAETAGQTQGVGLDESRARHPSDATRVPVVEGGSEAQAVTVAHQPHQEDFPPINPA